MTTSTGVRVGSTGRPVEATTPPSGSARGAADRGRSRRIPGLDGLRAVAILAVLAYHLNASWLPGGFLGVDVFFVVSGFLITTLLVRERQSTGRIAFGSFWLRRARRLVPALVLTVAVSVLIARVVSSDLLVQAGRQVFGAVTFSTNWVEISAGSSYFDATAPQLFMNFWSLAVEEQFYLVWPLVTLLLVRLARPQMRAMTALAIAAVSTAAMALLFTPGGDGTRVYYGTDTHVMGLMLGASLAFAWTSPALALRVRPSAWGAASPFAVPVAAVALVTLLFVLDEERVATFRGGIALASVATAVLVAGLLDRTGSRVAWWQRLADHRVLTWIGVRSYAIYLWHWPVILLVAGDLPSVPGTSEHLLTRAWCVLVTVALADLTHRFVETPFRRLGFAGVGRLVVDRTVSWSVGARRAVVATATVTGLVMALVVITAPAQSETARMLEANAALAAGDSPPPAPSRTAVVGTSASDPGASNTGPASVGSKAGTPPGAAAGMWAMPAGREIDGYGDSMMVGSVHALDYYFPGIRMDAKSNRRWSDGLAAVKARGSDNRRAVVLAFGTNAGVQVDDAEAVISALGPRRMIVLVNFMGPFSRIADDNAKLAALDTEHDNVVVADWAGAVRNHPEQLQSDRIHPSLKGSHLFAKVVRQAFADLSEQHTGTKVALKDLPMP
ncbi:MAG: acyltransferase [Intrasporangium sp.]|uniref:acyltransferase family protein n=1 Tax=Intrasporangium sp. TaxID=1925024 RepID=UPI00264A1D68|nr:acyltransferase family protein [Intrasporangium sp.]MDN5796836.1 acyltransferase [Intrasporangium sp.]